jgi:hypothetical protein
MNKSTITKNILVHSRKVLALVTKSVCKSSLNINTASNTSKKTLKLRYTIFNPKSPNSQQKQQKKILFLPIPNFQTQILTKLSRKKRTTEHIILLTMNYIH